MRPYYPPRSPTGSIEREPLQLVSLPVLAALCARRALADFERESAIATSGVVNGRSLQWSP